MNQESETLAKSQSNDLFDRIFSSVDKFVTYYIANPQEIVIPFLKLTIALNIFWTVYMIPSWVNLYETTQLIEGFPAVPVQTRSLWIVTIYSLLHPLIVLIALGSLKRIRTSSNLAISAIASVLVLQLFTVQIFLFLIGLYALFNEAFRKQVAADAPQWYRRIVL